MLSPQAAVSASARGKTGEAVPAEAQISGVEEHRVTIDSIEWRCLRAGSGPALLLIHGLMGYSWSWRFNLRELAQDFTVYAPDLPGTGFSQRSDSLTGSLESDAEGLISLMDIFGVERFHLLGSSRGGGVAMVLAGLLAQRGQGHRIGRVILCAPINRWSKFGRRRVRLFAAPVGRHFVIHVLPHLHALLATYFRDLYGDPSRIAPGSVEGYTAGLVVPRSFHHLVRIVRGWHPDLRQVESMMPHLQQAPTLLLWGSRDRVVYPSSAGELQARLANSTILTMEGVGHLPYEEVPVEFNRVVREFLSNASPRTPLERTIGERGSGEQQGKPARADRNSSQVAR
jgi:pimeloyl-ACP methyl ester carboxylesterase